MLLIGLTLILLVQSLSSGHKVQEFDKWNKGRITFLTITRITQILLLYCCLLSINLLYYNSINSGISIFNGLFQITVITQSFDFFIYFISILILQLTAFYPLNNYNNNEKILPEGVKQGEYSIIILFIILGSSLLISSNDLITMFLSIELQSYALYILSTMNRNSQKATSGGLKYFLLGGLASTFILLGSSLIYAWTGLTNFEAIYILLALNNMNNAIGISIIIIIIGYLFKVAAAPFHNWSPDVYDGVATIVTTTIAILPKISILIFLLQFLINIENHYNLDNLNNQFIWSSYWWLDFLLISSFLSLIIGTIVGLAQYKIKRLLAYSSISHLGFLLLALQIHTPDSIESFIFYLIQYTISNVNIFLILISFGYLIFKQNNLIIKDIYSPIQYISQLKGEFILNPYLSLSLAITLFSFAGVPPFIGFFGKQMVLFSAVKNGYIFLALIGIITSVISAAYYLKIVKQVYFDEYINNNNNNKYIYISDWLSYTISILTLFITFFMIKPDFILNSAHLLALTIYYI